MIAFERRIENTKLIVYIEDSLYKKNESVFNAILLSFEQMQDIKFFPNSLYIYSQRRYIFKNKIADCTIRCDTTQKNWIFRIINLFEYWCSKILDCTIIHGCLVKYNDKNILLLGKRKSGKSTLLNYFMGLDGSKYLDDDCVYIINDKFYGFYLPISMRNDVIGIGEKIINTFDDENISRYLCCYSDEKNLHISDKIDLIIFPTYLSIQESAQVYKMPFSNTFEELLKNIRGSKNVYEIYNDLRKIASTIPAYKIVYNKCQNIVDCITHLT